MFTETAPLIAIVTRKACSKRKNHGLGCPFAVLRDHRSRSATDISTRDLWKLRSAFAISIWMLGDVKKQDLEADWSRIIDKGSSGDLLLLVFAIIAPRNDLNPSAF